MKINLLLGKCFKLELTAGYFDVDAGGAIFDESPIVGGLKAVAFFAVFRSSTAPALGMGETGEIKLVLKIEVK